MNPQDTRHASRREFLRSAGGAMLVAASGAQLVSSASAATFAAPGDAGKKVGFAIVGLGGFALNQLIPALADCKHAKLVALVSGDKKKAGQVAAKYGVAEKNVYGYDASFETIKENPAIDVVYVVLPPGQHAEFTIRAAKAGKHVLCEKPMANTVEECQQMIDACRQANRKLMIDYCCQYEPVNLEAIRIARSGEIGKLSVFSGDFSFRMSDPSVWRLNKKLAGGGPLMDIGIYLINAARYISGEEPSEVNGFTFSPDGDPRFKEVEATCVWTMRFPSGALAHCSTSYDSAGQNRYRAVGTDGLIDLEPATSYQGKRLTRQSRAGNGEMKIPEINQFTAEMDHFAECVLNDKPPKTPGEEGLRDVRIMMAIYESARTGRAVKLA